MTGQPTREELLHLAHCARDGVALPAEHDALAAGITATVVRMTQLERAARRAEGSEMWMAKHLARQDSRVHGLTKELAKQRQRAEQTEAHRDQLAAALWEIVAAFTTVRSGGGEIIGHFLSGTVHPADMARWRAVLNPPKET